MFGLWTFVTWFAGHPATRGLVVGGSPATKEKALECYRFTREITSTADVAAWGKVAFTGGPSWSVYQVDDVGRCGIAACGNAIAAAAAIRVNALSTGESAALVKVPGGTVGLRFAVAQWYPTVVHQRWNVTGVKIEVEDRSTATTRIARVTGLNHYWIVDGSIECLPKPLDDDPCSTRIVAIDLDGPTPAATFFTCGGQRQHGGSPLTGLIALALAAKRIAWLAALNSGVATPRGFVTLPAIDERTGIVTLPPVEVEFEHIL